MTTQRYRHVILDRDGVLNREAEDGTPVSRDRWQWEDGALEGIRLLSQAGLRLSVATNQSCVGRGWLSRAEVDAVHERLTSEALQAGARIAGVWLCPHAPGEGCTCRKPAPGLLLQAMEAADIPRAETLFVGDATRDLEAAAAAGCDAVLIRTGKGRHTEQEMADRAPRAFDDLPSVARFVVDG